MTSSNNFIKLEMKGKKHSEEDRPWRTWSVLPTSFCKWLSFIPFWSCVHSFQIYVKNGHRKFQGFFSLELKRKNKTGLVKRHSPRVKARLWFLSSCRTPVQGLNYTGRIGRTVLQLRWSPQLLQVGMLRCSAEAAICVQHERSVSNLPSQRPVTILSNGLRIWAQPSSVSAS